jgi:isocitrate lyase
MATQNRFKTGLDIAKYTAAIMRKIWQIMLMLLLHAITRFLAWFCCATKYNCSKKHHKTTSKRYIYLSGWMVAALRSEFGPLPDQSMHDNSSSIDQRNL